MKYIPLIIYIRISFTSGHAICARENKVLERNNSSNFKITGKSGGITHGNGLRKNGGVDKMHKDYKNIKTKFLYKFPNSNLTAVTNSEDILEKMVLESFDNLM